VARLALGAWSLPRLVGSLSAVLACRALPRGRSSPPGLSGQEPHRRRSAPAAVGTSRNSSLESGSVGSQMKGAADPLSDHDAGRVYPVACPCVSLSLPH